MPPRKRTTSTNDDAPQVRACATDEVNERLLRTVPGYAEARSEIEDRTNRVLAFAPQVLREGCTKIPVVVHVVHRNATENISQAQIDSQIQVLNDDFRATNADKSSTPAVFQPLIGDARITFELATTDPDGNPTDGVTRTSTTKSQFTSSTDDVKSSSTGGANAWPADRYLNVWVCGNLRSASGNSLLGYAQFPGGPAATDGVVIRTSAFGTTGTAAAPFNLGRTATHEVGHWLNLRHIWGDDGTGCSGSDFVGDTPNQGGPNYGTPTFPTVTCSNGPNGDLFMNYMDYVDDVAMFMFTQGQVARMQAALDGPRTGMGTTGPCGKTIPKEIVKELPKDDPKEFVKERPKEVVKETPKELVKERPKEAVKETPKEIIKETPKDRPKDFVKEPVKEGPKELVKDNPKELGKDGPKDNPLDPVKSPALEPVKGAAFDPVGPIQPVGPVIGPVIGGGGTPFVLGGGLGGRDEASAALLDVVQRVGALLAAYSSAAAQGQLDAQQTAAWQQLSAIYAQLVALLG